MMIFSQSRLRASVGVLLLACVGALGLPAATARGDVFQMQNGDKVEGELLEDLGEEYRVRTLIGIIDFEKEDVVKIKKKPSPWRRYEVKRKQCPHTPSGHYELARWCRRRGLGAERLDELEKVIALDPDHSEARRDLGYVKNDKGRWIKPPPSNAPTPEELEARRQQREEEKLVRGLISEWFIKIKAIHRGRMSGKKRNMRSAKFRKAREQILAIKDPLALPALTGVLSSGNTAARRVLVEALAQFDEDEATMNLLVVALLDPAPANRQEAALELIPRNDDRVAARLTDALRSKDEDVLRNAAVALGILKARTVVEDLISVLSTQTRRKVLMSRPVYLGDVYSTFGGYRRIVHGSRLLRYQPTSIGVLGTGTLVGTRSQYQTRTVSVHRTEVQEALIAITGQNFGFDGAAWRLWWRRQAKP